MPRPRSGVLCPLTLGEDTHMKHFILIALAACFALGCRSSRFGYQNDHVKTSDIPFTFDGIEEWKVALATSEGPEKTYVVSRVGAEFKVKANVTDNKLIMCFCAPLSEYKVVDHGNYRTYEWPNPDIPHSFDGHFTMKYQGQAVSLDVHYMYSDSLRTWPMVKNALLSIRPNEVPAQQAGATNP